MFYIDSLYLTDSSNCYTFYLKRGSGGLTRIGRCFIANPLSLDATYTYTDKDTRSIPDMLATGFTKGERQVTYATGQAQTAIGAVQQTLGFQEAAEYSQKEGQKRIVQGLTPVYKAFKKVPIFEHAEVKYKLPEVTFVFINKDDSDTMLKEVEKFLFLVAGLRQGGTQKQKTSKDGTITWKGQNYYNKGGLHWAELRSSGKIIYHDDGRGFILKRGATVIDGLYTQNISMTYSKDTDLQGRPHSVQIKVKFIQPQKYWAAELYQQTEEIRIKAAK
jgi:hypothetical protein